MTTVHTLEQLDDFLNKTEMEVSDDAKRRAWSSLKLDNSMFGGFPERLAVMDPYSADYANTVENFMQFLFGGDYSLAKEGFKMDLSHLLKSGFPYTSRSPNTVGSYLISYGYVIRAMGLPVPSKILEIGCGTGSLSIHLARMGYELTAVDVNSAFTDHVRMLCEGAPGKVTTIAADMNELVLPPDFDAVLFYESFHHSYDHPRTIRKAMEFLKPGGMLVFAAEPIVPRQRDYLPYPWGPRLEGETLRAIRRFGWMELGFTEDYFYELLLRNGVSFRRLSSPETHWADLVIASRLPRLEAGVSYQCSLGAPGASMLATGWSAPEGWGTWSTGSIARILLDLSGPEFSRGSTLDFEVMPFLASRSASQRVALRSAGREIGEWKFPESAGESAWEPLHRRVSIGPGDRRADGRVVLEFAIESPTSPMEAGLSDDLRRLGLAVIRFTPRA